MEQREQTERGGWWGSTLSKLKSALSRTKQVIVDPIVEHVPDDEPAVTEALQLPVSESLVEDQWAADEVPPPAVPEEPILEHKEVIAETVELSPAPVQPVAELEPAPPVQQLSPVAQDRQRAAAREIDEEFLENLEERLIKADLGLSTAELLVSHLRREVRKNGWNSHDVENFLKREFNDILSSAPSPKLRVDPAQLSIVLVVGVNGTGKTTSIGKLCWRFKEEGKKVLMAAGDTFRAAAETQLEIWSERAGVDIVRLADGSDPGAVVFQALQKAKGENYDVLVIDTAGRLHNKANLMAELKKVRGVIDKHGSGLPLESLLVIDASTGQNGLQQAKVFMEVCPLTGVILTKLDGSAKGGIVFSIARDLKIPIKLIGLGEKIDDLRDFEPELFVEALF